MSKSNINKQRNNIPRLRGDIGSTGLRFQDGYSQEEFDPKLRGHNAIRVYKEMSENDPVIGAILFAVEMILRNVEWKTIPADDTPEAKEYADFFETCRHDMEDSWEDLIIEILSMLIYGWSAHEIVYKIRKGQNSTTHYSKYNDGLVGWRKLPIRSQDSLYKWTQKDRIGEIIGMQQQPYAGGAIVEIPIDKLLLFRPRRYKNNPEGRSVLRNAYRSWFFKKHMEEIEGIGIERDLAGLPVAYVPPEIMADDASDDQKATYQQIKQLVTNIRNDEQAGIVFPILFDENGNDMFRLELLSTGGRRQFDTNEIITRYDTRIAMTIIADFILLGHTSVGSFALSQDKTELFGQALGAWLKEIASVFNTKAIPKLMRLNGWDIAKAPQYLAEPVNTVEVTKFANAVQALVSVGVLTPDMTLEDAARDLLNVEGIDETVREEERVILSQQAQDNRLNNNPNPANGLNQGQTVDDMDGAR